MSNKLRSIFISAFPVASLFIGLYLIMASAEIGFTWPAIATILMCLVIVLFFASLYIYPRARTDANLKWPTFIIALGFALSICFIVFGGEFNKAVMAFSLMLMFGWILYLKWYSRFAHRSRSPLSVANFMPYFELENLKGEMTTSSSFIGKKTIYLFYRGNWCPLCVAQVKEIAKHYKELKNKDVNLLMISPQPKKYSLMLSKKLDLGLTFLIDHDNRAAKKLGILSKNGIPAGFQLLGFDSDTVMPTVVITDERGKIIYADLTDNYRVRPEPNTFLKILDQNKTASLI